MISDETLGVADITEILRLRPHRYPFLLIDRVIDIRGEDHGIGIKTVTINEAQLAGHFPDNAVMPGVLMVEGLAQTAAVPVLRLMPPTDRPRNMYVMSIDKAKFRGGRAPATRSNITSTSSPAAATCGGFAAKRKSAVC
jgi:3-hydroxyacyl-[acyl-carrier-protein] dehydratase